MSCCGRAKEKAAAVMRRCGIGTFGFAAFEQLAGRLIRCSAARRLPPGAKTVIAALFPYFSGRHEGGNISKYAMPRDYHIIIGGLLGKAAEQLREAFPDERFEPFCDASPINEVHAARLAGLGCVGDNGLLINETYGSYVFIGEIVTTLAIEPCGRPGGRCLSCGRCADACPAGVLGGGPMRAVGCLSALTQKKGALTAREKQLIRDSGCAWGCDICQDVCPLNRRVPVTPISAFGADLIERLELSDVNSDDAAIKYGDRAFMWKGAAVLKRNLCIIGGAEENNTDEAGPTDNRITF